MGSKARNTQHVAVGITQRPRCVRTEQTIRDTSFFAAKMEPFERTSD